MNKFSEMTGEQKTNAVDKTADFVLNMHDYRIAETVATLATAFMQVVSVSLVQQGNSDAEIDEYINGLIALFPKNIKNMIRAHKLMTKAKHDKK